MGGFSLRPSALSLPCKSHLQANLYMITDNNTTDLEQANNNYRTLHPEVTMESESAAPQLQMYKAGQDAAEQALCPRCGAAMDADADYCESCHNYVKEDVCSFCGAHVSVNAAFCPECGNPKVGIVCPVCRAMNEFAFCKQCGAPLTSEAKAMVDELRQSPLYAEMMGHAHELTELDKVLPYTSEADFEKEQATEDLRIRVLTLLAKDSGVESPAIEKHKSRRMPSEELEARKAEIKEKLSALLDKISQKQMDSPVKARNYAMACKPVGVRVAWKCNYKNAMHSSPCGCAKPQLGGKWIVLGKNGGELIKDDN